MTRQCQAGCQRFDGDEVKHHKHCVFYPESLSKLYDRKDRNTKIAINKMKLIKRNFHTFTEGYGRQHWEAVLPIVDEAIAALEKVKK